MGQVLMLAAIVELISAVNAGITGEHAQPVRVGPSSQVVIVFHPTVHIVATRNTNM
jgi:hypothetical protein